MDQNARTDGVACRLSCLYREALELYLKSLVAKAALSKTENRSISLFGTHSLRWLAQIVGQIIKAVGWENDFTCEGVASLTDFRRW